MEKLFGWLYSLLIFYFFPWQYAVAVTNVRLHSTAVSHSVCVVFSSTLPAFSLSATRQHTHIRTLLLWGGGVGFNRHHKYFHCSLAYQVLVWNTSSPCVVSQIAQHITSTNTPLSDKSPLSLEPFWHTVSQLGVTVTTWQHRSPNTHYRHLSQTTCRVWKPSSCLGTVCQASLTVCEEGRHLSSIKLSLWPRTQPWVLEYQVCEIQGSGLICCSLPTMSLLCYICRDELLQGRVAGTHPTHVWLRTSSTADRMIAIVNTEDMKQGAFPYFIWSEMKIYCTCLLRVCHIQYDI